MHTATVEERIRANAYELWLEDGSMEGGADEYRRRATRLVETALANDQRSRAAIMVWRTGTGRRRGERLVRREAPELFWATPFFEANRWAI